MTDDDAMDKLLVLLAEMSDLPGWSVGVIGPAGRFVSFISGRPGSIASSPGLPKTKPKKVEA